MIIGAWIAPFWIDNPYAFIVIVYELFIGVCFMFYEYSVLIPGDLYESFMMNEVRIMKRRIHAKSSTYLMVSYGGFGHGKGITEEDFLFWQTRLQ